MAVNTDGSRAERLTGGKQKTLRSDNRRIVLEAFFHVESFSIAELSDYVNLSKPTVTRIISHLEQLRILSSLGKGDSTEEGGRKPLRYGLNTAYCYAVAYHVFADEVYSALTDIRGQIVLTRSTTVSSTIDFEETLQVMLDHYVHYTDQIYGGPLNSDPGVIAGIAVGSHGVTDVNTGVTIYSPHFKKWGIDANFRSGLKECLGEERLVIVDNQIRFQVLSEQRFGEKTGLKNIVVVEAGEGLVAGIISNGEIRRGSHSLAGEIGHIVVDPFGTDRCACGSCGCFEAKVCTKQLIRIARDSGMKTTETKTANDVFKAAVAGNEAARSALKQVAYWFAIGFQTLVLVYDPDSIVIQGAYAEAGDWFLDEIQRGIDGLSLKRITKRPDIYYSSLGKNRGVLGGAAAVLDSFLAEFKETHL